MTPMNNPVLMIAQLARMGRDSRSIVQSMVQQDPRVRQAMQMFQGKSPQEMEAMVRNMCKERGTTPEELARSLGLTL